MYLTVLQIDAARHGVYGEVSDTEDVRQVLPVLIPVRAAELFQLLCSARSEHGWEESSTG